jgi:hypothetical protein
MNNIKLPTRVCDCESPNNATWSLFDIQQKQLSSYSYNIYIYVDDNKNVFMKPYTSYHSSEFESLFGFGIMCKGYDENKTIQVIAPHNYYKHFQ